MARPLRYFPAQSLVEVTVRTVHGRMLLRPSPRLNALFVGALARAQQRFAMPIVVSGGVKAPESGGQNLAV